MNYNIIFLGLPRNNTIQTYIQNFRSCHIYNKCQVIKILCAVFKLDNKYLSR